MIEKKIIEIREFVDRLNHLFNKNCKIIFDNNCPYPICINPTTNIIVFNLIMKYDLFDFLGKDYLKYCILHEFGHMEYNNQVKSIIEIRMQTNTNFIYIYNKWIQTISTSIDMNIENYWATQYFSTTEFMADYFVIKNIFENFPELDSKKYILWRCLSVLSQYNECQKKDIFHNEVLRYYHIPKTITNQKLNFKNDDFYLLINNSLDNSYDSILLLYNQGNNFSEYINTKFDMQIIKIMNEL